MKQEHDKKSSETYDLHRICRCCLKIVDKEDRIDIFELRSHESRMISYMAQFTLLTQLEVSLLKFLLRHSKVILKYFQVSLNDRLPKQFCPSCVEIIDAAYDLRISAGKNDKILRDYVTNNPGTFDVSLNAKVEIKNESEHNFSEQEDTPPDDTYHDYEPENTPVKTETDIPSYDQDIKLNLTQVTKNSDLNIFCNQICPDPVTKKSNKQFQCHHCNTRLSSKPALRNHMRCHTEDLVTRNCEKCNQSFSNEILLQRHLKQHGEVRKCPYCPAMFDMFKTYRLHITENHTDQLDA